MKRSIPPRTMSDVSRAQRKRQVKDRGVRLSSNIDLQVKLGRERASRLQTTKPLTTPAFSTGLFKKPRNWKFQTKPLFKKIKGPLVDVFHEAEEVLIVIDLGGFRREDVSLSIEAGRYSIIARRGEHEFFEEIMIPLEVDLERHVANFKNGVLEIVLPRKKESTA
jgi:HSP20 family molecular chaperone IbpA